MVDAAATLAYVFWHRPAPPVAPVEYERELARFHGSLRDAGPVGFLGSAAYRVSRVPWTEPAAEAASAVYVDWYLVEDWAALGRLNEAAVAPPHLRPHDEVARSAAWGTATVLRLRAGGPALRSDRCERWSAKPAGVPGASFAEELAREDPDGDATVWQRQLALGPAPEFCRRGRRPPTESRAGAVGTELRPVS